MIISHSKKFIFFHMIKTGGKSITNRLTEYISLDINNSKGQRKIHPNIVELMESIDENLKDCTNLSDLNPHVRISLNHIYVYLKDSRSKNNLEVAGERIELLEILRSPKVFSQVFKSFINDNYPKIYSHFHHHNSARIEKKNLPADIFNNYFKFVFVRHPLDWLVSIFFYFSRNVDEKYHDLFKNFKNFDEFIDFLVAQGKENIKNIDFFGLEGKAPQRSFCYDEDGNLLVDYVGKFENLEEDYVKICDTIGAQNVKLSHLNKSKHRNYLEYYTPETKRQVRSLFEEDFKTFDYEI